MKGEWYDDIRVQRLSVAPQWLHAVMLRNRLVEKVNVEFDTHLSETLSSVTRTCEEVCLSATSCHVRDSSRKHVMPWLHVVVRNTVILSPNRVKHKKKCIYAYNLTLVAVFADEP